VYSRFKNTVRDQVEHLLRRAGYIRTSRWGMRRIDAEKVFCVGRNKTGTTSLEAALQELGYIVGDQRSAERLIGAYAQRDFYPFISYCQTAEAFQDVPFSWPFTYVVLDQAFPGSKFILTVRDSAEACYASYVRHQSQRLGRDRLPTPAELKRDPYVYPGWSYEVKHALRPRADDELYDRDRFIRTYRTHNRQVKTYFAHRPDDLLVLNIKDSDAYKRLCTFLGKTPMRETMPWKNKTRK